MLDYPQNVIAAVIFFGIALYPLIRGVMGLKRRHVIISNPDADTIPISPTDVIFNIFRDAARQQYGPPVAFDRGPTLKVTGEDLKKRIILYFTVAFVLILIGVILTVPLAARLVASVLGGLAHI